MAKLVNPVKHFDDDKAVEHARAILKAKGIEDKFKLAGEAHKKGLREKILEVFKGDLFNGDVYGNFQTPLEDGNIVEVPISVDTYPLTTKELDVLKGLNAGLRSALFNSVEVITGIADPREVLLGLMNNVNLDEIVKVSKGAVTISITDTSFNGVISGTEECPVGQFLPNLEVALKDNPHTKEDLTKIIIFVEGRVSMAVRVGNRAKATKS